MGVGDQRVVSGCDGLEEEGLDRSWRVEEETSSCCAVVLEAAGRNYLSHTEATAAAAAGCTDRSAARPRDHSRCTLVPEAVAGLTSRMRLAGLTGILGSAACRTDRPAVAGSTPVAAEEGQVCCSSKGQDCCCGVAAVARSSLGCCSTSAPPAQARRDCMRSVSAVAARSGMQS